jgi:prepilin-type N-terminal cleavage/methylation domain-containing protein
MKHQNRTHKNGFTLIEILVVIAIIAVLAGILLAALSGVQQAAKKTKTATLLQSFGRACDEFALDHGRYPGLLPDSVIDGTTITSTQNALLELMGGARVKNTQSTASVIAEYDDFLDGTSVPEFTVNGWSLAFNPTRLGEGPWISGRVYEPYFSPKQDDLIYEAYDSDNPQDFTFPSLVDAWDTPIIYLRSVRKSGPIFDDPLNELNSNYRLPQFELRLSALDKYLEGALNSNSSILAPSVQNQSPEKRMAWLTLMLAHPTFWEIDSYPSASDCVAGTAWGTTRGRYLLHSAGPDATFLEVGNEQVHTNQVVNPTNPFSSLLQSDDGSVTPSMVETFDDVIVHGGA